MNFIRKNTRAEAVQIPRFGDEASAEVNEFLRERVSFHTWQSDGSVSTRMDGQQTVVAPPTWWLVREGAVLSAMSPSDFEAAFSPATP